jgi:sulfate permease, SulP family
MNGRRSYRPHTMLLAPDATGRWAPAPASPGPETEPGLIIYRFGADLFYANDNRFVDEVRNLVQHAPTPIRWFIVDAGAITDIDYSAAQSIRDLLDELDAAWPVFQLLTELLPRVRNSGR